ncbi:MAG: hypothetical protein GY874_04280 [Desulfobacteraceae bacterium]|nr:hypothetical protein [Desulfobacteraceae bacterium]
MYFPDNRARLLEIAAFLDRIDRYESGDQARQDFRYRSFIKALQILLEPDGLRTIKVQEALSDPTREPIEAVADSKAYGAWKPGDGDEDY